MRTTLIPIIAMNTKTTATTNDKITKGEKT